MDVGVVDAADLCVSVSAIERKDKIMADRELTEKETWQLLSEQEEKRQVLDALDILKDENAKPSLHDLCILELLARTNTLKEIVISQGREIKALQKEMKHED